MDIELIIQTFRPVTGTEVQTGGHRTHHSDIQTGDWDIEHIVQTFRPLLLLLLFFVVVVVVCYRSRRPACIGDGDKALANECVTEGVVHMCPSWDICVPLP